MGTHTFDEKTRSHLIAALEYDGNHDIENIEDLHAKGFCDLWKNETASIITELLRFPKRTLLHIWLAGGDMEGCKKLLLQIEKAALETGCDGVSWTGRPGWKKIFPEYKQTAVSMLKEFHE